MVPRGMSYVLDHQKQQQVLGLGRLGWPVRRIAEATGVDRATARGYLLAAGIRLRGVGVVLALFPAEVAAVPVGAAVLPLKALLAGPRLDQRPIDREVLVDIRSWARSTTRRKKLRAISYSTTGRDAS